MKLCSFVFEALNKNLNLRLSHTLLVRHGQIADELLEEVTFSCQRLHCANVLNRFGRQLHLCYF